MTLFFGFFLAMGIFFFFLLSNELLGILTVYRWKEVPATIVSSSVVEGKADDPFSVAVKFKYEWDGKSYTSERYYASSKTYPKYGEASGKIVGLSQGVATHCYVDPKNPAAAVLRREGLTLGFFLLLPLVFVVIGGAGVVGAWLPDSKKKPPISAGDSTRKSRGVAMLGGGIFALVGGAILFCWFIPALSRSMASTKWKETPCTIISSRVKSHSDSDGTTYSVDVFYSYSVDGKEYKSNTFSFIGGSSSGRSSKEKVVANYPKGSKRVCYVNPNNPADVVLKRGVGWEMLFGLIPMVFLGVGVALFLSAFRKPPDLRGIPMETLSPAAAISGGEDGRPLKAKATRMARFLGVIIFSLFWNGIVSVFLWDLIGSYRKGSPDLFLTFFLIPFVLIGVGSIFFVIYSAMALVNPRCQVNVTPTVLQPGQTLEVAWTMAGAVGRVQRLRIVLGGREEAIYQRGTSTSTDTSAFARFLVTEVSSSLEMEQGTARIRLPEGLPPSFKASKNKIIWALKVHGEIPRWPDITEEYEVSMAGAKA